MHNLYMYTSIHRHTYIHCTPRCILNTVCLLKPSVLCCFISSVWCSTYSR